MQAKSYAFPPYSLTMSTAVCLSFGDTPHQNCGSKENFSNAVGCELKFLKIEPTINNPLIFPVKSDNLIRVNGCRLNHMKGFLRISGVVWFKIEITVSNRSH